MIALDLISSKNLNLLSLAFKLNSLIVRSCELYTNKLNTHCEALICQASHLRFTYNSNEYASTEASVNKLDIITVSYIISS